jgi:CheY-like chemotaxis protein
MVREKGPYDIFFIDWKMPEMDGFELARRIKEGSAPDASVVIISSAELNSSENNAGAAFVDKFAPKPIFPSNIADCISECLGMDGNLSAVDDAEAEEIPRFEGRHIMLAEDVEINKEIVLTFLEPMMLSVDCAENGAEAVRLFAANPERYDMIFMDVQMPEMDGYEATRRIRAMETPGGRRVPIIAMTANVFREDIERCMAAGMNDHIGKPLDFGGVLLKLKEYLSPRTLR